MAIPLLATLAVPGAIPSAAQSYVDSLGLERQPFGNYFRPTWSSTYQAAGLPEQRFAGGERGLSSAIYNLYTSDDQASPPTAQRGFPLHRLRGDETWYFFDGDGPINVYLLDMFNGTINKVTVGRPMRPQYTVPGDVWAGALLANGTSWALTGAQTTPAFDPRDSQLVEGNASLLAHLYKTFPRPTHGLIARLTSFGKTAAHV